MQDCCQIMKNRAVQYALTFSQVVKISVLKLCKELNKAFCMLMKQVAPEPINSFSRQYSVVQGHGFLMGFGWEQKACLDADAEGCSNLCLGTVQQLGWDQGISKVTFAPPVWSCSVHFFPCIPAHTRAGDCSSNSLYFFFPHTHE